MSEVINPGHRDHPCDFVAGSENASPAYVCCRCGAAAASAESLCAPEVNS